jgi:hypothetical protein
MYDKTEKTQIQHRTEIAIKTTKSKWEHAKLHKMHRKIENVLICYMFVKDKTTWFQRKENKYIGACK